MLSLLISFQKWPFQSPGKSRIVKKIHANAKTAKPIHTLFFSLNVIRAYAKPLNLFW